jgi:hypothetical protein
LFTFLILVPLVGPLPDATLVLRIHLGRDQRSKIALAELTRDHPWWTAKRIAIQQHYKIRVDNLANNSPSWQIGNGPRQEFRPGTFNGSGMFMLALKSIADIDQWERNRGYYIPNKIIEKFRDGRPSIADVESMPCIFPPDPESPFPSEERQPDDRNRRVQKFLLEKMLLETTTH